MDKGFGGYVKKVAVLMGVLLFFSAYTGTATASQSTANSPVPFLSESPRATPAPSAPAAKPVIPKNWYPKGYVTFSNDDTLAYKADTRGDPCYSACRFVNLTVISQYGCPNGFFVTVNFLTTSGVVVDDSIDSISSVRAMQKAKLQFITYDNSGRKYQVTDADCYSSS
ncbi:MAG: hypothetical protein Q8L05_02740 [Actinomycetota bacterium]|nr:hypothetical protein [Actinomycetota bacterium]MDP2288911.1 hypothetical protein [Actinomycetota bacterium]